MDAVQDALQSVAVRSVLERFGRTEADLRELQDRLLRSGVDEVMVPSALANADLVAWYFSFPDPLRLSLDDSLRLINWARYGKGPVEGSKMRRPGEQPVPRAVLVAMISEALADAEKAIRSHPSETVAFFDRAREAHEAGMAAAPETDWSRAAGLSLSDLTTIHRYLFAVAFISAYWDVHADLARRNKAASTASLLLAGLGLDPEAVLKRLLRYEEVWRLGMMSERLVPPFPGPTASTS